MAEGLHAQIERERRAAFPNAADLIEFRRYVAGDQDGTIGFEQKQILGTVAKHPFADNVADMMISATAARLDLTGFTSPGDAVAAFLTDDLFVRNQMGDLGYDCHYAASRDGNHAVMLNWEADERARQPNTPGGPIGGRVTLHLEDWWDGTTGIFVAHGRNGRPSYAVKDFREMIGDPPRDRLRRNIYFPGEIHRFIKEGGEWSPYPLDGEPANGIVAWTRADGRPLGIPVVPFSNPRFGRRLYGSSDLAGGFLAVQDQLNDIQMDVTAAARLLAFQIITATGVTFPKDPVIAPGTMLQASKETARFGAIPAGDITQLTEAHGLKLQTVARNASVPIHIITGGNWPAGIALVQAEKPLITKVERLAKTIGPSWATVAHRATEIANAFGRAQLDEDSPIAAVFAAPEKLDPLAVAEVRKMEAEAQAAIEMLTDRESLIAIGIPEVEADARLQRRQAAAAQFDAQLTGIGTGG
jgi:hypothetical protein